jgi:hypothetical protein
MKKWLDKIWAPFDEDDPTEWFLLCCGLFAVIVIVLVEVWNWIYS